MSFISSLSRDANTSPAAARADSATPLRKYRVLVVDDHPITRHGLRTVIDQQMSFEVCGEAACAADALQRIETLQPDLVVVDIALGPTNGIELTRDLKARAPHLGILVVSMHEEMTYAERALRAGAQGYLMKQE